MESNSAFMVVDMQNDFITGSLAVTNAANLVSVINDLRKKFTNVIFTQDWHPQNHVSFAASHPGHNLFEQIQVTGYVQTLWPVHCVADTDGAKLHSDLAITDTDIIVKKGMNPQIDSYSCFFDVIKTSMTTCHDILQSKGIDTLYFAGVATDYCVKFSVIDALELGYKVFVFGNAIAGVSDATTAAAIEEMKSKGAIFI